MNAVQFNIGIILFLKMLSSGVAFASADLDLHHVLQSNGINPAIEYVVVFLWVALAHLYQAKKQHSA